VLSAFAALKLWCTSLWHTRIDLFNPTFHEARRALWRIWSRTNRYLYPDRYIKMILTFVIDNYSRFKKTMWKSNKMLKFNSLSPRASILWRSKCIYEVIDMYCSSQCYVGGNNCKCKYTDMNFEIYDRTDRECHVQNLIIT
jgi:hypothetical protein